MPYTRADIGKTVAPHIPQPLHEEQVQFTDDRPDEPVKCPICKGTGEVRFDYINKHKVIINGYVFKPGVNVVCKPCECMD
jgi:hypothetical protein